MQMQAQTRSKDGMFGKIVQRPKWSASPCLMTTSEHTLGYRPLGWNKRWIKNSQKGKNYIIGSASGQSDF